MITTCTARVSAPRIRPSRPRAGTAMRACLLAVLAALPAATAHAQERPEAERRDTLAARLIPADVEREVADAYNATDVLRANGALTIEADRVVEGDVVVLRGPVTIAGRVTGRVVAINADVRFVRGARVEGQVLVVGGEVRGQEEAFVGGDVRVYRAPLAYRLENEQLVVLSPSEEDARWWRRRWRTRNGADIRFFSARTYNRVEGIPLYLGPSIRSTVPWGRLSLDVLGIFRSGDDWTWNGDNVGHAVRAEVRVGGIRGMALGGELYDEVADVERWHLEDTEVGLASFLFQRDYRDYFVRHGGGGYLKATVAPSLEVELGLRDEVWSARFANDPWSLFRNRDAWRANPLMDEGRFHIGRAALTLDTRNAERRPRSGWLVTGEYERGSGSIVRAGAASPGVRDGGEGRTVYGRGFVDLRRYNRIAPDAQLNLRLVAGGWLHGDELPLQRRLSLSGAGAMPGYDFRRVAGDTDVLQCSAGLVPAGSPAQCERILFGQVEYRADIDVNLFGWLRGWDRDGWGRDPSWLVFADVGRGWLVGDRSGELSYPKSTIPSLGTFKLDVGLGLDLGPIGVYVAKSATDSKLKPNFFVRLEQRF